MTNADIVLQLRTYANELMQSHTNLYRVRAFRQAVTAVMALDCEVVELVNRAGTSGLKAIPGIGNSLAETIATFALTGKWQPFDRPPAKHQPRSHLAASLA